MNFDTACKRQTARPLLSITMKPLIESYCYGKTRAPQPEICLDSHRFGGFDEVSEGKARSRTGSDTEFRPSCARLVFFVHFICRCFFFFFFSETHFGQGEISERGPAEEYGRCLTNQNAQSEPSNVATSFLPTSASSLIIAEMQQRHWRYEDNACQVPSLWHL